MIKILIMLLLLIGPMYIDEPAELACLGRCSCALGRETCGCETGPADQCQRCGANLWRV